MQDKNERGLVGDFFCGAGGASVGIEEFGVKVDFAVNHDQTAIKLHSRNHPETYHMTEDIFTSEVERFVAGRKVSLIWASPDCTHFSKAKGKTPRKQGIRMLPYAVYFHAAQIHPEVICMENVAEIQGWCPIEDREDVPGFGQPVKVLPVSVTNVLWHTCPMGIWRLTDGLQIPLRNAEGSVISAR